MDLGNGNSANGDESITSTMSIRDQKIKRYKNRKALEERLNSLSTCVEQPHVDEDVKRDHHLTLVRYWASLVEDELYTLRQEDQLLSLGPEAREAKPDKAKPHQPIKPFILTRNAAQKAVFGAGYPSLPSMTLDEFYAEQVNRGHLPPPTTSTRPSNGPTVRRIDPADEEREADEKKAAEEDDLADGDDPAWLEKARQWDKFKDDNRRGDGNRMNRS